MRRAFVIAASVTGGVLAYPVAGVVGGLIPSNAGWAPPERGITIYIESNGIHTGIVMPKLAAGVDWREDFPARDLVDPRYGALDHLSIGWGERNFYIGTPTWADLKPSVVLGAAVGSDETMVHVDHVPRPAPDGEVRRLVVRPAEYRRLAAYVRASLVPGGERHPGYFRYDVFYAAHGRYSAIHTCNAWVGNALRFAGIRVGAWTPFPGAVMRWFPRYG
ncbi:TIGR02117 family protein [Sphingomonas radiodurans]|uniref:TIGR02117 family protein n=1 Tax=Sphingomonas radiodurans TaxID=2890321 RepID=UPI001E3485D3|nr:TIGR02117 family protein [Sphingomonas radiodurans]WBH15506.1 TIGR02117 family protein [Sphingomonas radiodurans]